MSDLPDLLRDYRAACERVLLGLAWADQPIPARRDPLAPSDALVLPAPADWAEVVGELLEGPAARALGDRHPDVGAQALLEVDRLQTAAVGPDEGILRGRDGAPSPAWERLARATAERRTLRDRLQVLASLDGFPEPLRARARRVADRPVHAVRLTRHAASDATVGRYRSPHPLPVDGAPGWGIEVRLDPTPDGLLIGVAERVWLGEGEPGEAPVVEVWLREGDRSRSVGLIAPERTAMVWYEESLGGQASVEARVR